MISVIQAASYIYNRYLKEFGVRIDEMKLHKLLYFTQRESLVMLGEPMFGEQFAAWRYGPVIVQIRERYREQALDAPMEAVDGEKYQPVFDYVFSNYAIKSSWNLSMLSHGEVSWQRARGATPEGENCEALMQVADIKDDAERIKLRRFYFNEVLPKINATI